MFDPESKFKTLTPEQRYKRAVRCRMRFRGLVRFVAQNLPWLNDPEGDEEVSDDVLKNIAALRRRRKITFKTVGLYEKSILSKPAVQRTAEEKAHLYRVIGGIKCFRRYPPHVKKELVGVTYFKYYGPGRVVLKEGHRPVAMYFILSGDLCVSKLVYDPILKKTIDTVMGVMEHGMMFGEVALLHNSARVNSVTTGTHCELLCLTKEDFDKVLKETIQELWDSIKSALLTFSYFQEWDDVELQECCILSKLRSYQTQQTILGDGLGVRGYTHFIVQGQCQVIEHLLIEVKEIGGKKFYKLYNPERDSCEDDVPQQGRSGTIVHTSFAVKSEEIPEEARKCSEDYQEDSTRILYPSHKSDAMPRRSILKDYPTSPTLSFKTEVPKQLKVKRRPRAFGKMKSSAHHSASETTEPSEEVLFKPLLSRSSLKGSQAYLGSDVRTVFMQVCLLNKGACFAVGEKFTSRRVVALTPVECLLVPKYWLMMHNKANMWTRVRNYLDKQIPSTEKLLEDFVEHRKWMDHKRDLVESVLSKKRRPNNTRLYDVPFSVRIRDGFDL